MRVRGVGAPAGVGDAVVAAAAVVVLAHAACRELELREREGRLA